VPVQNTQPPAGLEDVLPPLARLTAAMDSLEKAVERVKSRDGDLLQQRTEIVAVQEEARKMGEGLQPRLADIRSQLEKLGKPPEKDAAPEAPQIAAERARLGTLDSGIDGAIKTTNLLRERAAQLTAKVQELRASNFTRELLRRTQSPLLPAIWREVGGEFAAAGRQIVVLSRDWWDVAKGRGTELIGVLAGVIAAFLIVLTLTRRLVRMRLDAPRPEPPGFFMRAATAGWIAPALALVLGGPLLLLYFGLDTLGLLYLQVGELAAALLPAILIWITVAALSRAILQPQRPQWRLLDISDRTAARLTRIMGAMAAVYAVDLVLKELIRILFMPLTVSIAEAFLASIAFALLLFRLVLTPFEPLNAAPGAPVATLSPRWLKLPVLAVAIAIAAASMLGYVALGRFIAGQVVLTGSVVVVVLLLHLAIRAVTEQEEPNQGAIGAALEQRLGLDATQKQQFNQALALFLNVVLGLAAIPLILAPWGFSVADSLGWLRSAVFGFEIGQFRISLARILLAALMFLVILFATRLLQRWLATTVLNPARTDPGIANSVHTGAGYGGFALATLAALAYSGLDITNIAIVAGALSVGIGFGLQSIVNNFVSGLILLVERPIKVGDQIAFKEFEGHVRRISVRSTEIETFDRASLIVPNSELITSVVKNKTHRNALGRVLVTIGVSTDADPQATLSALETAARECPTILQYPAPYVSFDRIGQDALHFSLGVFVADLTKSLATRNDLTARVLLALRAAGVNLPNPQFDIRMRDLDWVRGIAMKIAEERARAGQTSAMAQKPDEKGE